MSTTPYAGLEGLPGYHQKRPAESRKLSESRKFAPGQLQSAGRYDMPALGLLANSFSSVSQ